MKYIHLDSYGLSQEIEEQSESHEGYLSRVLEQHGQLYRLVSEDAQLYGSVSGTMKYEATDGLLLPVVGDWVMVDRSTDDGGNGVIQRVLERKSLLQRKAAGKAQVAQGIAANMDVVFICMSMNFDFNIRRLERYINIAWDSGATPVVVLTKSDLCDDIKSRLAEVQEVSLGIDVITCSGMDEDGYQGIEEYIKPKMTVVFIGSSGVGKSTIVNYLLKEERLEVRGLRNDDKGRHTTTSRQLFRLPSGGIVIDTPGMREIQSQTADVGKSFQDIEELSLQCRFRNCSHEEEQGCAVTLAVEEDRLSVERLDNYRKMQKESIYEGLSAREIENVKISRMFGSKRQLKNLIQEVKKK